MAIINSDTNLRAVHSGGKIMVNKLKKVTFLSLVLSMVITLSGLASATEPQTAAATPSQFVQSLGDTALSSLTDKKTPRAIREKRVREILENNFDIQTIGKFAMGTYWKDASDTQRKEYLDLFENTLVSAYTTRFEDYSGQALKVHGFTNSGATDFIVASRVIQKDGPAINLEWRVRKEDSGLKIVDVVVEGISMSVTQRSDFSSVIQHGGGNIDTLLTSLREQSKTSSQKT